MLEEAQKEFVKRNNGSADDGKEQLAKMLAMVDPHKHRPNPESLAGTSMKTLIVELVGRLRSAPTS